MPNYDAALLRVLEKAAGPSRVAEHLGIVASAVTQWTRVPARHAPRIEALTGIPGRDIRPDLWGPPPGADDTPKPKCMTLKDWLAKHGMSDAEFARVSGIGQRVLVQKYRHGRQTPSLENLERIRKATGGMVTANDVVAQRVAALCPEPENAPANDTPKPKSKRPTRSVGAAADTPTSSVKAA
jgi:transcriptional regulator with XRE-family HTH domain